MGDYNIDLNGATANSMVYCTSGMLVMQNIQRNLVRTRLLL